MPLWDSFGKIRLSLGTGDNVAATLATESITYREVFHPALPTLRAG